MAGEQKARVIDPGYRDEHGKPERVVLCPGCEHMELWTDEECQEEGVCRYFIAPCSCELEERKKAETP